MLGRFSRLDEAVLTYVCGDMVLTGIAMVSICFLRRFQSKMVDFAREVSKLCKVDLWMRSLIDF